MSFPTSSNTFKHNLNFSKNGRTSRTDKPSFIVSSDTFKISNNFSLVILNLNALSGDKIVSP